MTIRINSLLREIDDCRVSPERLYIDPQAMVITDDDIQSELGIVGAIGSTGSGSGAASARRILNRRPGGVRLERISIGWDVWTSGAAVPIS
jgi:adenylosuccinate synthase